ncbi:XRE family transcriptional regulator [Pseudogemmatithrix spongiicola]|uniref:XRE family transcriptional regulator n=1 Tax=Pseudogemmatithrix spongiicola TaxID=3062599 RepID=A0AA49JX57_9BACT|nr:XRE family transcriptional regulator [Gemmatimonadaceae bacterium 'strain 138']WKW16426.1 XRE family transcriptional regulator [Gemmatimonadaceae bacterium 'strain 318']
MKTKIRRTTGNVFADLGFAAEDAEHLKVRADLMVALTKLLDARGLSQAEAAKLLGVSQPRISDLVCGKIDKFSVDTLISMLAAAGAHVSVSVRRGRAIA